MAAIGFRRSMRVRSAVLTKTRILWYEQSSGGSPGKLVLHRRVVEIYTYNADSKKRLELVQGTATTLVWDGEDYLQGRA